MNKTKKFFSVLVFISLLFVNADKAQASGLNQILRQGSRGEQVVYLQQLLRQHGYNIKIDGIFGVRTKKTVCEFQNDNQLSVDGIVGSQSWSKLLANSQTDFKSLQVGHTIIVPNDIAISRGYSNELETLRESIPNSGAQLVIWDTARQIYTDYAIIIDVDTGLSFNVKRYGGHNHADSEPLTALDTEIMRKIYGGKWSWNRRSVVVIANGQRMAASMNGMPHGGQHISGNNFDGHFCIHFLGSATHNSRKIDPLHQQKVYQAKGM